MSQPIPSQRIPALIAAFALTTLLCGGTALADDGKWAQGTKPVGKLSPTVQMPTDPRRLPVYIEQQAPPYHSIRVGYVPRSYWKVTFEAAGGIWTPWYCELYPGTPPGQPTPPQYCNGVPKAETVKLRVRMEGLGPKAGKTAYISGAQWAGDCAGTAGDTCTLVMDKEHKVTVLTDAFG